MHFEKLVISVASDLSAIRRVRRSCTFVQFEPVGHAESYLGKRMAEVHRMHFKRYMYYLRGGLKDQKRPLGPRWGPTGPMGPHGAPWGPMGPHGAPRGPVGPHGPRGAPWGSTGPLAGSESIPSSW